MSRPSFRELLDELNARVLGNEEEAPEEPIAWLGMPQATDEEVAAAEARLGITLPPSYRAFLTTSNGWAHVGNEYDCGGALRPVGRVDWFRSENADWIAAYTDAMPDDMSPEEHLDRGDCARFRRAYLSTALQISEVTEGGVYLLCPDVVDENGEWEAWHFANHLPGADRYPSFRELVRSFLQRL